MGKAVPKGIKSKASVMMKELPEAFGESFEGNKKSIHELELPFSKWTTNVMAGYITRLHKKARIAEQKKEEAKRKRAEKLIEKEAAEKEKENPAAPKETPEEKSA